MTTPKGPLVFPGDDIDSSNIPSHPKKALQLGPGLRHLPPTTILPTIAGQLVADRRKNSIWVEHSGGRVCSQPWSHYISCSACLTAADLLLLHSTSPRKATSS